MEKCATSYSANKAWHRPRWAKKFEARGVKDGIKILGDAAIALRADFVSIKVDCRMMTGIVRSMMMMRKGQTPGRCPCMAILLQRNSQYVIWKVFEKAKVKFFVSKIQSEKPSWITSGMTMSKAGWRTLSLTLFGWWTSFTLGNPEEEKVNWSVREVMERELEALKEMDEEELVLTLDFLNSKRSSVLLVHILVTNITFFLTITSQVDSYLFWNYLYGEQVNATMLS